MHSTRSAPSMSSSTHPTSTFAITGHPTEPSITRSGSIRDLQSPSVTHDGATTKLLAGGGDGVLSLLVVGHGAPRVVPLADKDIRVGRSSSVDVVLDDESLSRHHATFRVRAGRLE